MFPAIARAFPYDRIVHGTGSWLHSRRMYTGQRVGGARQSVRRIWTFGLAREGRA